MSKRKSIPICFITHPYHRGGVTSWSIDALNYLTGKNESTYLISVKPKYPFISGKLRPLITDFILDSRLKQHLPLVGMEYELGTNRFRAYILAQDILRKVPKGSLLIPSDDEACWMACAMVADIYKLIGIYHSDNPENYETYEKFHPFLTGIVTVSNRIKNRLNAISISKKTIPCGIVMPEFRPLLKRKNKLLWIGRMESRVKRVSDLTLIAQLLKSENIEFEIEVWGHGEYINEFLKKIEEKNLNKMISFKGWGDRKEILKSLNESKVLLQTSNFEGMSIAVMEALSMGCMVVSSKVSGVEDYARKETGKNLIGLFPVGDIEKARDRIIWAFQQYNGDTPAQARAFAEKYFDIKVCMDSYLDFAESLPVQEGIRPMPMPGVIARISSAVLANLRYWKYKIGL